MLSRVGLRMVLLWACLLQMPAAHAELDIGPAGAMSLSTGALALGCTDIEVGGGAVLYLGGAAVTGVRNVTVQPGALVDFGTGSITFAGAFVNAGGVLSGLGQDSVRPVADLACAPNGPSVVGVWPLMIPTLNAWALSLLAMLLGGCGIFLARHRSERTHEREQSDAIRN